MANGRCRHHGGKLTGGYRGVSAAGWSRTWAGSRRRQAMMRALGLKWYGGRPRKPARVVTMAEEAKTRLAPLVAAASVDELMARPVEGMTPAELTARASLRGILQLYAIIDQPLDFADLKQMRLVGDMALGVNKLFQKAAQSEREGDVLGRLLAMIAEEKTKGGD